MGLIKINFIILILLMAPSLSFAMPGIKITHPENNSTVNPGEQIAITLESVEGFVISRGRLGTLNFFTDEIWNLPATFTVTIPQEAIGTLTIMAIANGKGSIISQDEITLRIAQTATLQSLIVNPDKISIKKDWDGNINYYERDRRWHIGIKGMYSDGVTREISDIGTTYISTDSAIASVNTEGEVTVNKVGEAKIIVSYSGVTAEIPVIFEDPQGIRPLETKPPTISMDIQSPANNQGGWYNNDITIILVAQDNEGGSGIKEIVYSFPSISAESNFVENNQVVIPFSMEGINLFRYGASDREGNNTGQKSLEIHLDKTPPASQISALPEIEFNPDFIVEWSGIDETSGIQDFTIYVSNNGGPYAAWKTQTTATQGIYNGISGHTYRFYSIARDLTGNVENSKTNPEAVTTVAKFCTINSTGAYFIDGNYRNTISANLNYYDGSSKASTGSLKLMAVTPSGRIAVQTTSIDELTIAGDGTVNVKGKCAVNNNAGYSFDVSMKDAANPGINKDQFSIKITGPNNFNVEFLNKVIAGGDIAISWQ